MKERTGGKESDRTEQLRPTKKKEKPEHLKREGRPCVEANGPEGWVSEVLGQDYLHNLEWGENS